MDKSGFWCIGSISATSIGADDILRHFLLNMRWGFFSKTELSGNELVHFDLHRDGELEIKIFAGTKTRQDWYRRFQLKNSILERAKHYELLH